MPSASSVKLEKPQSSNANAAEIVDNNKGCIDSSTPLGQVYNAIAHKIRNLEKRKGKLESYRDTEKSGKELSNDQKVAVSKYNEVTQTLEFARDFQKQILQIATVSDKELKKKQKKDETAKRQNEISKIREVLTIQDILNRLTDNEIREDFLTGSNGACKLEQNELDILIKFQNEVIPKRPNAPDEVAFKTAAQKSADHFLLTIDGKAKEFAESKYTDVKTILKNIQKCGYFDKAAQQPVAEVVDSTEPTIETNEIDVQAPVQETPLVAETSLPDFHEAPAAANVPVPSFPPQPLLSSAATTQLVPIVQPIAIVGMPRVAVAPNAATVQIHPQHLPTVQAVEQGYFKHHQYVRPDTRPLAEVIGAGNFYFLQDSELDSPDVIPGNFHPPPNSQISPNQAVTQQLPSQQQAIPQPSQQQILTAPQLSTQTFNNQSFQNIAHPPMYPLKPIDGVQNHITGFPQAPIVTLAIQPAPLTKHQQKPTQISSNQNQHANNVPCSGSNSFSHNNLIQGVPKAQRHRGKDSKQMKNDQRVPEINEWKPEDATKPPEEITVWQSPAELDWNADTTEAPEEAWSNSRYPNRNNSNSFAGSGGNGIGSRERNNRGSRPQGNGGSNGFRNRSSNSYQTNGRQIGNGNERGNGNTFYRTDNFYPNGGYRGDNKQEGGYKGGNFRSRDTRDQINGTMRTGGPRNLRNGDIAEGDRGSNRNPRTINKGGSYGSGARPSGPTGNTRPQSAVNA